MKTESDEPSEAPVKKPEHPSKKKAHQLTRNVSTFQGGNRTEVAK